MRVTRVSSFIPLFLAGLIILGVINAFAATNTVPSFRLDDNSLPITANDLKPSDCNSLNLSNIVVGSSGTAANDLILGTTGNDNLRGGDGDDCIVGGGGDDTLQGQKNNDIVLGQDGNDALRGNQDTDICDGGAGTDTGHISCETELNIP
jgi:Ca2+-binding RTX toxin-like protein